MHLPAMCVIVMHSTFIVDQYMALFHFLLCIAGECARVYGVEVFLSVQVFWLIFDWRVSAYALFSFLSV